MNQLVYLGLGANLKNPKYQIKKALTKISQHPKIKILKIAPFYQTQAIGNNTPQPDYINSVVKIKTRLSAYQLLKYCQQLENQQGRIRKEHWGARTLDIDILLYHQQIINIPLLIIPHPRMHQRAFVLNPLSDINPKIKIPKIPKSLTTLLLETKNQNIKKTQS